MKWHLSWTSSISVVISGDISKTRNGQALLSILRQQNTMGGTNQALGPRKASLNLAQSQITQLLHPGAVNRLGAEDLLGSG